MGLKLNVVAVDDEVDTLTVLKLGLEFHGAEVTTFTSSEEALSHLRAQSTVDLLITDLRLPGIPGDRLVEMVRQDGLARRTVILTGMGDGAEVAVQADEVLGKPLNLANLKDLLDRAQPIQAAA